MLGGRSWGGSGRFLTAGTGLQRQCFLSSSARPRTGARVHPGADSGAGASAETSSSAESGARVPGVTSPSTQPGSRAHGGAGSSTQSSSRASAVSHTSLRAGGYLAADPQAGGPCGARAQLASARGCGERAAREAAHPGLPRGPGGRAVHADGRGEQPPSPCPVPPAASGPCRSRPHLGGAPTPSELCPEMQLEVTRAPLCAGPKQWPCPGGVGAR